MRIFATWKTWKRKRKKYGNKESNRLSLDQIMVYRLCKQKRVHLSERYSICYPLLRAITGCEYAIMQLWIRSLRVYGFTDLRVYAFRGKKGLR